MPPADINYLAVVAAAAINMGLGALWYSQLLFAKQWSKLTGRSAGGGGGSANYVMTFLAALIMSYVLAFFIDYAAADTLIEGAVTGLWIGVGFVLTASLGDYLFAGRHPALYWINNGYQVFGLTLMGALLAVWS